MTDEDDRELKEWRRLNLPSFIEHNQPSKLTKEMFRNLNEKFGEFKEDTKDALENTKESLQKLAEQMEKGFTKMHDKQDKTNGKVLKNTAWRQGINGAMKVANIIMLPIILAGIIKYLV